MVPLRAAPLAVTPGSGRVAGSAARGARACAGSRENGALRPPPRTRSGRRGAHDRRPPSHGSRSIRRPLAVVLALALALVGGLAFGARPAAAAEPANLRAQLTDDVGALSASEEREVSAAQETLLDESGVQLWVWFTDTTGGLTAPDFAAETARLSSLGGTDFLVVLAMDDRAYGYWASEAIPLSNAEIEQILSTEMEPGLREGDNAGAIVSLAEALGSALAAPAPTTAPGPTDAPAATPTPSPPPDQDEDGGSGLGTGIMVIVVVAIVGLAGWFFLVRRRYGDGAPPGGGGGAPPDPLAGLSDEDLNAEANSLLLATDDAVRDSAQELGFAEAQFGAAEAATFGAAIEAAKGDLRAAFEIRQQLDDATPEDRPTRRRHARRAHRAAAAWPRPASRPRRSASRSCVPSSARRPASSQPSRRRSTPSRAAFRPWRPPWPTSRSTPTHPGRPWRRTSTRLVPGPRRRGPP